LNGFDKNGDEAYWNVSSDNVNCLCFCDIDEDGTDEIIIGSEDNYIRVGKGDEILFEINEVK